MVVGERQEDTLDRTSVLSLHMQAKTVSESGQPDTQIFGLWEETGKAQKGPNWILLLCLIFYPLQPPEFLLII